MANRYPLVIAPDHHLCCECGQIKPLADFNCKTWRPSRKHPNGRHVVQPYCRVCQNAINRAHYQANKAKYIDKAERHRLSLRPDRRITVYDMLPEACACGSRFDGPQSLRRIDIHGCKKRDDLTPAKLRGMGHSIRSVEAIMELTIFVCPECYDHAPEPGRATTASQAHALKAAPSEGAILFWRKRMSQLGLSGSVAIEAAGAAANESRAVAA